MHILIPSIVKIFQSCKNTAAAELAVKIASLPDNDLNLQSLPTPPLQHLNDALAASDAHPFVQELAALADYIPWEVTSRDSAAIQVKDGITFCRIVGPDSVIKSDICRMGFYLQAPNIIYPSHSHNAEEVYFILSGTAFWQKDTASFTVQSPHTLIHHLPNQPHAMHTQEQPLLAIWGWLGDIDFDSYQYD